MGIAGLLRNLHPLLVPPPTHPSNQNNGDLNNNNNSNSNNNQHSQQRRNNPKIRHNIRQFNNKSLAIDASSWLHKAAYTCAERLVESTENGTRDAEAEQKYTKYMIDRCSELLTFAHIDKIYLVFDGKRVPLKSSTNASRESKRQANLREARRLMACGRRSEAHEKYRMCVKGNETMARVVAAKVQEKWGRDDSGTNDNVRVKCVWSPYEADSQLAKLCVDGWAHAVVTEDSDLLLYSAVTHKPFPIIYKLDRKDGSCDVVTMDWLLNSRFLAAMNGSNNGSSKSRLRSKRERDLDYIYNNSPLDDDDDDDDNNENEEVDSNDDNNNDTARHPCELEYDDQGFSPIRRALPLPSSSSNNGKSKRKKSSSKDGNAAFLTYLRSFANKELSTPGAGVRLFVQACVLSGCDYVANRLTKVGPVTAFKLVKEASHRGASIRFERVLKSLPSGSKLVAEASDKRSDEEDDEQEYDDFFEQPDTDRDAKGQYEELLSKSEAIFYYHLALELSTNKILPLVENHRSSNNKEENNMALEESFRPCIERFEDGLTFVGSIEEALKNKPTPLPAITNRHGHHFRAAVSQNNGWLSKNKNKGGSTVPVQNSYKKPSNQYFQQKKTSTTTSAAATKQRTIAELPKATGLTKYFGKQKAMANDNNNKKSSSSLLQTGGRKNNHFQKPLETNAATASAKINQFAAFKRDAVVVAKSSKKKSPIPLGGGRPDKAAMKSPHAFSPVRFDYGGFTPQGSEKKTTKLRSDADGANTTRNAATDEGKIIAHDELDRGRGQLKQSPPLNSVNNNSLFDYEYVSESPNAPPGTGSLSKYIDETKNAARRVSTSPPENIKQREKSNHEVVDLLLSEEDDNSVDSCSAVVEAVNENQINFSQSSKIARKKYRNPFPAATQTSSSIQTRKKSTSSSALLAGFARQRSSFSSTSCKKRKSRFFPPMKNQNSGKRPKGTPSLKSFMVNKD